MALPTSHSETRSEIETKQERQRMGSRRLERIALEGDDAAFSEHMAT